jgi:DNA-binding NarL/FixJ family response regulator
VLALTTFNDDELLSGVLRAGAADELTPREFDVLALIARGHTNAEIADALTISGLTVKTHIGNIFMKLGLRDRAAAIVFAYQNRLVEPR